MQTNRLGQSSEEQPGPIANAAEIASCLLYSFEQFGIDRDSDFAARSSTIAFTNAIVLAEREPGAAARLLEILDFAGVDRNSCCTTAAALVTVVQDDDSWVINLRKCLSLHWSQIQITTPADSLRQQIIFALSVGLEVGASHSELVGLIVNRARQLGDENRFLTTRLVNWANYGFEPRVNPFIEFVSVLYSDQPIQRNAICSEVEGVLSCAQLLPEPWRLSFWVEQAWTRGRRFAERKPDILKQLLIESPKRDRAYTLGLYKALVLKPAESNALVDIERATLMFFAITERGRCAVEYCAGDQPRKLVRLAFDFAFWMGILSAISIPDHILSPVEPP